MPYLLHEHPMELLAPVNHPRMECEKTQINNSFESILDEDLPYSVAVKNITAEEARVCSKRLQCIFLCVIFIYYISNLQYPEKLEATFFTNSVAATGGVLRKRVFLEISQNLQENKFTGVFL